MGGYYGAALHHAGHPVHFLLNRDFDHVRRCGLKVEARCGDLSIAEPSIFADASKLPPCDVVMVCLKTTHNHLLPALLSKAVREGATVLMMQNGLGNEQAAAEAAPQAGAVLGGLAFLCSNKIGPGHIRQLDYGQVRLGQYRSGGGAAGLTEAVRAAGQDLESAGIPVVCEEDLTTARWKKLIWNVPYNGLCTLMGATTDRLMNFEPTRQLCRDLMNEVLAGARACGCRIEQAFIETMLENTEKMVAYKPSMMLDHEASRPLEIEAIYAAPLAAAAEAGCELPRIRMLYQQLSFLQPESP